MVQHFFLSLQHSSFITTIDSSVPLSVLVELTHYFSFFVLIGSATVVNLRILNVVGHRQTASELADMLFPVVWTCLGLVTLSGFLMFAGDSQTFIFNPYFYLKLLVLVLAVIVAVLVRMGIRKWDLLPAIPARAKVVAFASIVLWLGVILAAVEIPSRSFVP